tara:strand:- start:1267 stop:5145 length:3879 start_codon:yes stop_codon:yes gene_type:complete
MAINKDIDPKFLKPGDFTFALNSILTSDEETGLNNITEPGNEICVTLPSGVKQIGDLLLDDGSILIFGTDNSVSYIFRQVDCKLETLIDTSCLGFKTTHFINSFFRIINGCERVIYFTDKLNSYKSINIDKLGDYKKYAQWDCDLMRHFIQYSVPSINEYNVINAGGSLPPGSYEFLIQYPGSNWIPLTEPINIFNDNLTSSALQIEGNVGINYYDPSKGGIPDTIKAIQLNLSNIDEKAVSYSIGVIRYLEGLGIPTEVHVISDLTSEVFTYTGTETFSTTTIQDININQESFEVVNTHSYIENRILFGNVKKPYHNWAEYQQAANNISSKYVTESISKNITGSYYNNNVNFMRDEVYAFGIVWVMTDGSYSPAFHIPGRDSDIAINNSNSHSRPDAITAWDTEMQQSNWPNEDLDAFPISVKRWEVYNTAIKDNSSDPGYVSSGQMAYYNNKNLYPNTKDCNNVNIYPTGNIRYHKFPDGTLEPHVTATHINKLGIKFSNITTPPNVQGYYIVVNKPDGVNQTVVAKGTIRNGYDNATGSDVSISDVQDIHFPSNGVNSLQWSDLTTPAKRARYIFFTSPEHLLGNKFITGTHYKHERLYQQPEITNAGGYSQTISGVGNIPTNTNRGILDGASIGFESAENGFPKRRSFGYTTTVNNKTVVSYALSASVMYSEITQDWTDYERGPYEIPYASMKNIINIYPTLNSIVYRHSTTDLNTSSSIVSFNGDTYIDLFNVNYGYHGIFTDNDIDNPEYFPDINSFYVESRYNLGLRIGGAGCSSIYSNGEGHNSFLKSSTLYRGDDTSFCDDYFLANLDYSSVSNGKFHLHGSYDLEDCDNDCFGLSPNHIYYSEKATSEDTYDALKKVKVNNYTVLPPTNGAITNMFEYKDNVYVQTPTSLWMLPTSHQSLQSTTESIYLGTGSFLQIPPRRLSEPTHSGARDSNSHVITEFGVFFVDSYNGKLSLLNKSGFKDVSPNLTRFLKKELPLNLDIKDDTNLGYQWVFDRFYERVILTKKDYKPKEYKTDISTFLAGDFVYYLNQFGFWNGTWNIPIDYSNTTYFQNKSFTISYDLRRGEWVSFHSYLPNYMYNYKMNYYTSLDNVIWKHSFDKNFTTYYGSKQDHILEIVHNKNTPFITKVMNNITYLSEAEIYDENTDSWEEDENITFDRLWAYTNKQSSGIKKLINKNNTDHVFTTLNHNTEALLERNEKYWNINGYRDMSIKKPVVDTSWASLKTNYYIDKIPANIDVNKSFYSQERIKDKFVKLRLYFKPTDDYRLKTSLVDIQDYAASPK